jgi:hypothetical protein
MDEGESKLMAFKVVGKKVERVDAFERLTGVGAFFPIPACLISKVSLRRPGDRLCGPR